MYLIILEINYINDSHRVLCKQKSMLDILFLVFKLLLLSLNLKAILQLVTLLTSNANAMGAPICT